MANPDTLKQTEAIVSLKDITKVYGSAVRTQVLFDVSLDFAPESFNAIIGQSGSGKSTLLNIIGTLDRPTTGEVTIAGRRTDGLSRNQLAALRNETIGFIFQFHYLLPEFTAQENVLMPWWIKNGKPTPEVLARADELMRLMGIDHVRRNLAGNMSGGQQQRTAIARSLIMNPKIILADEPTGNLDSDTTETVYSLMRDINRTFRTTFIIITHDRKVAEKADRIVEIKDGRISIDLKRDIS